MIGVIAISEFSMAQSLVGAAFRRVFTQSQVVYLHTESALDWQVVYDRVTILVVIQPSVVPFERIKRYLNLKNRKLLLFGALSSALADYLSVSHGPLNGALAPFANCASAPSYQETASALTLNYDADFMPIRERPLLRYDFQNEWDNLGAGQIRWDSSIWSVAEQAICLGGHAIASIQLGEELISHYAGIWNEDHHAILWVNRSVGPIDSHEWRLCETFCASYRYPELPCLPAIQDIPYGYDAAVTMRLDCDEDIASAAFLFEQYQALQVPFSLAIHTRLLEESRHYLMLHAVLAAHGSILSHSATHPKNWGGSYEAALQEAVQSKRALEQVLKVPIHYAVSPFHETPHYALLALRDAGYFGCVGGIVGRNPEFLLARGGELAGLASGFIGHSQSCMLHGDCMLRDGDPLRIYKQAFRQAKDARAIFGFLDHPFSDRYAYGWENETARAEKHAELIHYMRDQGNILFWSEQQALDFLRGKPSMMNSAMSQEAAHQYAVEYGGRIHAYTDVEVTA